MANLKATLLFALVATCLAVKPPGYVEKPAVYDESPPRYSFEYEVKDAEGGSQGHTEVRRGVYAVGGYYTRLPGENGAQRVSYYADDWGFHPVLVAYGGHGYNTRIAFGDKAVATANAASGATGIQGINAIGVNIPHSINPLPDLTQTGAAALAAEAPQIPDAAQLVASVGQPPAPPQPPKQAIGLTPAGTTILSQAPNYYKPVQPVIQQQIRPAVPLVHYQRPRLPFPAVQVAPVRPAVPVAPVISTSYPKLQPIAPVYLSGSGASGPSPTSFVSSFAPVKTQTVIAQPAAPVVPIVSTTPAPATILSHAIQSVPTGSAFIQGISAPATSFVSSGAQTVSKTPVVVPTYQTVDTSIGSGVNSLKESSAAAAAAAASALSAAAASSGLKEASIGQGVSYSQQSSNVGLGAIVSSGSVLGSAGNVQQTQGGQLVGFGGQYSQVEEGGYHYERPVGGGLSYRPIISGVSDKGVGGVESQTFQYSPYLTTGYQSGFTYSPGYQTVYTEGPQISYQTGTTASSFSQTSSTSQGSSVYSGEGEGFFVTNKEITARPQGGTSFQTHIDHGQTLASIPPPTASQTIGSGLDTIGFTQQETYVTTPTPPVTVTESITVTPRPTRPIIVADLPKSTPTFSPEVETSTPAPPPSSTLSTVISSSTIASPAPSTIEVTTPTPLTSSTPITPYYSTFPANAPCILCQSTRSQEVTLLTAPASDTTSTTLDSELQQIFFPDSTPSIDVGRTDENIITETVDVTPTPFSLEERGGPVTTSQPTVSVKVLNEDRATTSSLFESTISGEGFTAQREGGGQFFSGGNGQFFGGSGSGQAFGGQAFGRQDFGGQAFGGQANEFASFTGGGSQFVSGASGGKSQILTGAVQSGQLFSGQSGSSEFNRIASGGSGYYSEGGDSGGGIISVTSTPAPPVSVSLGVTPSPSPSVLYVDRPVAVPIPYAVPQLVPYAVKGSSASSFKERHGHRISSSSSGSSSETYESSTPSVISVTQITKIRTSGRKNADRGFVKQVVEESGASEEEEEEEEFIVRGGSVKLASGRFGTQGSYSRGRLPPPPFRSSSLRSDGNYGDRIRVERPRKLCIEYGGFKPPLVPSDPDYNQSINLR